MKSYHVIAHQRWTKSRVADPFSSLMIVVLNVQLGA